MVSANERGDTFYVILKGVAYVILQDAINVKCEVARLSAGDCFGEIAILLNQPRSASVRAGIGAYFFDISYCWSTFLYMKRTE